MTVLVIGAGYIGSHIVKSLLDQGNRVTILTRSPPRGLSEWLTQGAEVLVGDAGVTTTVADALRTADHVVYALSSLMPGEAEQEPQLDLSLMLQPLLEVLDQLSLRTLPVTLISSGGTVYGSATRFPTPEDAPTVPVSAYGITRLTAERFVLRYGTLTATPVRCLRIGNAYGPGQVTARGQGIVGTILEHCLAETPFTIFGDGSVERDFVHVDDIARATAALVDFRGGPSVVNVASGTSCSLTDLCAIVEKVTGRTLAIERREARSFDVPKVVLDISILRSLVDFEPRSLVDGVRETWRDLLARSDAVREDVRHLPNVS